MENESQMDQVTCQTCGKTFETQQMLDEHNRTEHGMEKETEMPSSGQQS